MILYVIFIILIILILLFFISYYNNLDLLEDKENNNSLIEGYDERYRGLDVWKCGDFCKRTAGCYGFAYNPSLGICYPSKETLLGKPTNPKTLFASSYLPTNMECNKMDPITVPEEYPGFNARRNNSVYLCKQAVHFQPQWYLHNRKGWRDIGEGKNLDEVFDVDFYSVREYNWPINKFNNDQKDLLINHLVSRFPNQYNVSNIYETSDYARRNIYTFENDPNFKNLYNTNINNTIQDSWRYIETFDNMNNNNNNVEQSNIEPFRLNTKVQPHFHPKTDPNSDMNLDFGLDNIYNLRSNLVKDASDYLNRLRRHRIRIPIPRRSINLTKIPKESTSKESKQDIPTFIPYDDYNAGDYLNSYKCVSDISMKGCMNYCENNPQCAGIEYNPVFGTYNNVCCPKRNIGQFFPRKWIHRHGKFYAKI